MTEEKRSVNWLFSAAEMPNLVSDLTATELGRIGQDVVRTFELDKRDRAEWDTLSESAMKLAKQVKEQKSTPWPGASNVKHPLITVAAIQFAARAYPEIVKSGTVVKCQVFGDDPKPPQQPQMPPQMGPPQLAPPTPGQPQIPPQLQQLISQQAMMESSGATPQQAPVPGPPPAPQVGLPMPQMLPRPLIEKSPKRERGDRIAAFMNYQLTVEMEEWDEDMDRLLHILPVLGQCFKKTYFSPVKGRNVSELVLPDDCYVNSKAKTLREARRITHVIRLFTNDVYERVQSGLWEEPVLGVPVGVDPLDSDAPHEFLEQHRYEDLDGDGYKEPYIVTVHKQSMKVVRIQARFQSDGIDTKIGPRGGETVVKITPDHYFTHFGFIPNMDGSLNYLGFGQLMEPINAATNAALNQLLDAGKAYNSGGGFIGRGVKMRGGVYNFVPGEWKLLDVPGAALRDNIFPIPRPEPSQVLFQLLGFLVQAGKDISSVQDIMIGGASMNLAATMPVGTVMALVEQGLKVFTAIYKRVYRSLSEEFRKIYTLNSVYLDSRIPFVLSGRSQEFVGREDFTFQDVTVLPVADPDLSSDMQRLLKAQALKDISGRPGLDEVEVTRRLVRAIKPENVDQILLSDEQIAGRAPVKWTPPPPPQAVLAQAKAKRLFSQAQVDLALAQMELAKFQLQVEDLKVEIGRKKAETVLLLAKAEAAEVGPQLELYKQEMQMLAAEADRRIDVLREGLKGAGQAAGMPQERQEEMPGGEGEELEGTQEMGGMAP